MKKRDFDRLAASVKQAGAIKHGKVEGRAHDADRSSRFQVDPNETG